MLPVDEKTTMSCLHEALGVILFVVCYFVVLSFVVIDRSKPDVPQIFASTQNII